MTFSRVNLLGWAYAELLTSAQMNQLDINMTRALDGYGGGTYNPSAAIKVNNEFEADATSSADTNATGLKGTGKGNEPGVEGIAGSTGIGGKFSGGSTSGSAGDFTSYGTTDKTIIARAASGAAGSANVIEAVATAGSNNANTFYGDAEGGVALWGKSDTNHVLRLQCKTPGSPTKPIAQFEPFSAKPSGLATPDDNGGIWTRTNGNVMYYHNGITYNILTDQGSGKSIGVRAWGKVTTDGAGGATLDNGFGCTVAISGSAVRVTFLTSMTSADYAVTGASFAPGNDRFVSIDDMAATYVDLVLYDISAASSLDMSSTAVVFCFHVFGDIAAF